MRNKKQKGFTLIELLVVLSIISLLASIVITSVNSARLKARDTVRHQTLLQLQKALEAYYSDHNSYPVTPNWYTSETGTCSGCMDMPGNYIPGLTPTYIGTLPHDPNPTMNLVCSGWKPAYLYYSDGQNYKLLSHCSGETGYSSTDPLYDPVRPGWAWQVSTPDWINQ